MEKSPVYLDQPKYVILPRQKEAAVAKLLELIQCEVFTVVTRHPVLLAQWPGQPFSLHGTFLNKLRRIFLFDPLK